MANRKVVTQSQAFRTEAKPYFGQSELTKARVTATALIVPKEDLKNQEEKSAFCEKNAILRENGGKEEAWFFMGV